MNNLQHKTDRKKINGKKLMEKITRLQKKIDELKKSKPANLPKRTDKKGKGGIFGKPADSRTGSSMYSGKNKKPKTGTSGRKDFHFEMEIPDMKDSFQPAIEYDFPVMEGYSGQSENSPFTSFYENYSPGQSAYDSPASYNPQPQHSGYGSLYEQYYSPQQGTGHESPYYQNTQQQGAEYGSPYTGYNWQTPQDDYMFPTIEENITPDGYNSAYNSGENYPSQWESGFNFPYYENNEPSREQAYGYQYPESLDQQQALDPLSSLIEMLSQTPFNNVQSPTPQDQIPESRYDNFTQNQGERFDLDHAGNQNIQATETESYTTSLSEIPQNMDFPIKDYYEEIKFPEDIPEDAKYILERTVNPRLFEIIQDPEQANLYLDVLEKMGVTPENVIRSEQIMSKKEGVPYFSEIDGNEFREINEMYQNEEIDKSEMRERLEKLREMNSHETEGSINGNLANNEALNIYPGGNMSGKPDIPSEGFTFTAGKTGDNKRDENSTWSEIGDLKGELGNLLLDSSNSLIDLINNPQNIPENISEAISEKIIKPRILSQYPGIENDTISEMKPVRKEKIYMDGYFDVKIDMLNAASEEGVPPEILWAISATESDFRPDALGYTKDKKGNYVLAGKGINQMTPIACEEIGVDYKTVDKDVYTNLKASAKLLSKYRKYVDNDFPNLKTEEDKWRMTALYYNSGAQGGNDKAMGVLRNKKIKIVDLTDFAQIYDELHGIETDKHKLRFWNNLNFVNKNTHILNPRYIEYQKWLREHQKKRRKMKK